jgi:thioredoxin reductase (NADPH)
MASDERARAYSEVDPARVRDLPVEHMFPRLSPEQISRLAPFGHERAFADGEVLWEAGTANISFFVVLDGAIAILVGCEEHTVVVHEPGGFTGDVDMLSGRAAAVRAEARGATRVLEVGRDRLRGLVQTDVELGEIFLRAFILRRAALIESGLGNVVFVGSRRSGETLRLQEFLTRNNRPFRDLDVDHDPSAQALLDHFGVGADDVPVVFCWGGYVLKRPTVEELAECLGLSEIDEEKVYDLVVVGAGPAGLAAAVYGASEGLDVLVLEAYAPGGQAGSSSKIENYLGFPTGISGKDLAGRAFVQAEKFGAAITVARTAARLSCDERPYRVRLASGGAVKTRSIVIATGAEYRRPACTEIARFEGLGVYYAATAIEAKVCEGEDVIVVGGGNSAGQAAVFFSGCAKRVHVLVRGPGLKESMSKYLIRRIEETPNIELLTNTEIEAVEGDSHLERVTWFDSANDAWTTRDVRHVFLMTGASPNTGWLEGCVALDEKGFVKTGPEIGADELRAAEWPLARPPFFFETSVPGVFAVGDVRSGSTKRCAAAVGEGSACCQLVHKAIAEGTTSTEPGAVATG